MDFKRVWHSFRLWTFASPTKRCEYLRKHHVFAAMGEGCSFQGRKVPLYPNLIKFGNNVRMAGNVSFLTHDMTHMIMNNWKGENILREDAGCISIGNNVFIGSRVVILKNVKIGDNVIIAPGSVVETDIPSNSVAGGVPAKVQCKIDILYAIRKMRGEGYPKNVKLRNGDSATEEAAKYLWAEFDKKHEG